MRQALTALATATTLSAGMIAATSGTTQATRPAATTDADVPRLAAVEIADGVLFNEGAAAERLTSLQRGPTEWTETMRDTQRRVHRSIESDRRFAYEFVENMQSGDPLRVAEGMSHLGKITREVLERQFGRPTIEDMLGRLHQDFTKEKLFHAAVKNAAYSFDSGTDTWKWTDTWLARDVAVAAVVVAVLVIVITQIDATPKPSWSARENLMHEMVVNNIAIGLARRR
jgi:hypothetical protein